MTCGGTVNGDSVVTGFLAGVEDDVTGDGCAGDGVGNGAVLVVLGLKAGVIRAADGDGDAVAVAGFLGQGRNVGGIVLSGIRAELISGHVLAQSDVEGLGGLGVSKNDVAADTLDGVGAVFVSNHGHRLAAHG